MVDDLAPVERLAEDLRRDAARRARALAWWRRAVIVGVFAGIASATEERARTAVARVRLARLRPSPAALPLAGMERLHDTQLPRWMLRLAAARHDPWEAYRARVAIATIVDGARDFPGVQGAAHGILALDATEPLAWSPWRALPVIRRWNGALDAAGLSVHVDANVETDSRGPLLVLDVYRTVHDGAAMVGARKVRARYLQRIDRTNLVESWLGAVTHGDDGARVILDRVRDFALDRLWARLDPARDDPASQALRDEAAGAMDRDLFDVLARTAPRRAAMLDAARAINDRGRCGSAMVMPRIPWRGFDPRGCVTLLDAAEPPGVSRCPRVTTAEALAIAEGTLALARAPRLEAALAALVNHAARAVAIHEARHAADRLSNDTACAGCPRGIDGATRDELAAYVASFTDPRTARTALVQACGGARDAAHGGALALALPRLGREVCARPPRDLWRRARALATQLFGRYEEISLDGRFARAVRRVP